MFLKVFKKYPTTCWFAVGVGAVFWKVNSISAEQQITYAVFNNQRALELKNAKQ